MDAHHQSHGVLFYSVAYVNCILLSIFATTGRWIFLLLFVLTLGLACYVGYLVVNDSQHLKAVGRWVDSLLQSSYRNVISMLPAKGGGGGGGGGGNKP